MQIWLKEQIEKYFLKPIIVSEVMASDKDLIQYMVTSGENSPEKVVDEVAEYLESICSSFDFR